MFNKRVISVGKEVKVQTSDAIHTFGSIAVVLCVLNGNLNHKSDYCCW